MNLWIVPAANEIATHNVTLSLANPVAANIIAQFNLPNGIRAWGKRPADNLHLPTQMQAGDICLFYTKALPNTAGSYNWAAIVDQVIDNPELAAAIWNDAEFRHVFTLSQVWPISITPQNLAQYIGGQGQFPMGMHRVSENRLQPVIQTYGTLPTWITHLTNGGQIQPANAEPAPITEGIKLWCEHRGISFTKELITKLYAAIRAKPFVILAGNSGTGKSRLVRLFAEACGATVENGGFNLVAVRPDWNDSGDLIGHLDLNNEFRPGQVFTALLMAHKDMARPVFVCLDEMNLARVEHYFSDFLSKIESRRRDNSGRVISDPIIRHDELTPDLEKRVPQTLHSTLADLRAAGRGIDLPSNLIIVGTVNMDETTHAFSRKVLDRAHTLEIEAGPLSTPPSTAKGTPPIPQSVNLTASFLTASDMLPDADNASKLQRVSKLLDELNDTLAEASLQVAYRTRDEAAAFFIHATAAGLPDVDAEHAIVMQKILPRVQGSSPRLARVLHKLLIRFNPGADLDADDPTKLSGQLLTLRRDPAKPALVRKLAGMWLVYIEEGFTSFWIA